MKTICLVVFDKKIFEDFKNLSVAMATRFIHIILIP